MNGWSKETLNIIGGIVALGLVVILGFITWALVYRAIPAGNENTLIQLVGVLSANVGVVVGFFFVSNVGAKRQSETLDKAVDMAQAAQAAALPPQTSVSLAAGESVTVQSDDPDEA